MTDGSAGKVRTLADAAAWRGRQRGPVVFTNGVFDLLVVGLNTDASARRLAKGPARPVAGERARARVLAALAAVDCVVLFDEDTPLELIQALAPDVLVKGADYSRERIVGADWVEARGGRVVRVPVVPGFSTTALVERLRAPS
jgi:D-beta-D-heptose 7-phosphate kinase/D-beta-D-heptose 1-phosphate adenosyltransferase